MQCSDYDVGNGICDPQCNFEHSLWDLGDCCQPFHTAFWCNDGEYDWHKYNFERESTVHPMAKLDLPYHSAQAYLANYDSVVEKYCQCHITGDNAAKPYGNQSHCIYRIVVSTDTSRLVTPHVTN